MSFLRYLFYNNKQLKFNLFLGSVKIIDFVNGGK